MKLGTLLSDVGFIRAAGLRLRLPMIEESICPSETPMDRFGLHRLSCHNLAFGRLARHTAINDLLARAS